MPYTTNMQIKGKWKKVCPADYKNAEQTDSDHPDDPDYRGQEQAAPKISQNKGCPTYRKRQEDKKVHQNAKRVDKLQQAHQNT